MSNSSSHGVSAAVNGSPLQEVAPVVLHVVPVKVADEFLVDIAISLAEMAYIAVRDHILRNHLK